MHPSVRLISGGVLLCALSCAWAARKAPPELPEGKDKLVIAGRGCPAGHAFGGLPIRSVDVRTPFIFLPWIQSDLDKAKALAAPLPGTPYRADQIHAILKEIAKLPFAQLDRDARVGERGLAVSVACQPQGLDLVFLVYAVSASTSIAVTWEARQRETAAPEQQGGSRSAAQGSAPAASPGLPGR